MANNLPPLNNPFGIPAVVDPSKTPSLPSGLLVWGTTPQNKVQAKSFNPYNGGIMNLGEDVYIHENSSFSRAEGVTIGDHTAIDYGFYCTVGTLILGRYVHISSHVSVIGGENGFLEMEDFSFISAGSRIVCGSESYMGEGLVGPRIPPEYKDKTTIAPITFERFAGVGSNVIVMPGVTLAEGSIVGGNSYVSKDTEPWTIYVGNPAKPVKVRPKDRILEYAKRLLSEQ